MTAPVTEHFYGFLLCLMVTCCCWAGNVQFSGLCRWNAPKHAVLVKMLIRPCKPGFRNALGPILGGHIPEGEFAFFFPPVSLRYNWCIAGWALWISAPVWLTPVTGKFRVPKCLKRILSWCQHLTPCSPPDPPFSPVTTCWDPLHKVLRAFLPCRRNYTHKNLLFLQCLKATVMNTYFLEHSGFFGGCWGGSVCLPTDCPSG